MSFNTDEMFSASIDNNKVECLEEEKKKESKCKGNITYYRK